MFSNQIPPKNYTGYKMHKNPKIKTTTVEVLSNRTNGTTLKCRLWFYAHTPNVLRILDTSGNNTIQVTFAEVRHEDISSSTWTLFRYHHGHIISIPETKKKRKFERYGLFIRSRQNF